MKNALAAGILLIAIESMVGTIFPQASYETMFGVASLVLIGLAIITSGLAVSGSDQRANYHSETKEGRTARLKMAAAFFVAAIPSILCYLLTVLF
ncbi:DUF5316 domain-containing protein [Bacillus spizizenii]|uniref:DUF5316 domain-containing protein n=2 Tax=Bacillus spizizenii TaxID=96241 RepID=A0A9Q4H8U5_BACSC|nr:DUF5316 family protein [Bacillus spizizenii]KFI02616.1 hypothetical protein JN25_13905 [Bacillus sp. BSC154]MDU7578158.1 DUF5316 family protein [Bacillus subtilis]ADM39687.1 hypothetical protein BSUW23_18260 [Bacillus spizizenii str. W23]AJW85146.1 hypothetical protein BIS30_08215 [Bacillus spizizenii]EFG92330.1 hypothetical protein BSU6633_09551 [Bacillus spizizenii ATCC 6633 = JCM 2499]